MDLTRSANTRKSVTPAATTTPNSSTIRATAVHSLNGAPGTLFKDTIHTHLVYSVQDGCEENHSGFCAAWTSAGYAVELSIALAVLALFAILIGLSTGSRRRRIWRAVAGLVGLHAAMQIVAFAIVTDSMRTGAFPALEYARPGVGYAFNTFAWIFSVLITTGVVITGISADMGQRWAAGNRAYRRIDP
jgi:hypothetical protein